MSQHSGPNRAGKTLVELLVIIATASTILTISAQLLFRISRSERAVREAGTISRSELRLIRDLRSDIRAATSAEISDTDDERQLRLTASENEIAYRATAEGIERRTARTRELYRLGGVESHFRRDGSFVTLQVEPRRSAPGFAKAAAGSFRIVAAVGADIGSGEPHEADSSSKTEAVEAPIPERSEP